MTPPGPWWGEPAGVLLFFVLPCAAWTVWRLRREAKREQAEWERLAHLARRSCPMDCGDPECPNRVVADIYGRSA